MKAAYEEFAEDDALFKQKLNANVPPLFNRVADMSKQLKGIIVHVNTLFI